MRRFKVGAAFVEPWEGDTPPLHRVILTEEEILENHIPESTKERLEKYASIKSVDGWPPPQRSLLDEWCVVNWAEEIKDEE